jgi:uncharacterized DUF497 family protein
VEAKLSQRLREAVGFDWDDGNVEKNWTKHAVRFTECEEVFYRAPLVAPAPAPARRGPGEERFVARGETALGRLLSIIFTFRGDRVRVISARDMSRRERQEYSQREEV